MKSEFEQTSLDAIAAFANGKKRCDDVGSIPVYGGNGVMSYSSFSNASNCVIIGRVGAYCGSVFYEPSVCWVSDNAISVMAKDNNDIVFIYYLLSTLHLNERHIGTSQPLLTQEILKGIECVIPNYEVQKQIAAFLRAIDDKITTNKKINDNLEQQVRALYRQMFVDTPESIASVCRADEFFDISIGKTPPRKEPQWFTTNPNDVTWVSISDMGSCGTFISNSSEQLTAEAVEKFNVKVVPANTVLLSFKLTVGRIAITDGEMTTNEAIAHFKTDKPEINEYLYCYLKDFNYQTMGSTSSIATAVNSKIVKAMPFSVPTDRALERFHGISKPMFSQIKTNQAENRRLANIRDLLLPRLMSGELDVSDIEI